jgi:preprotein translocase SecE subunit
METYKSGQGSFTRLAASLALGVTFFLGCANVYYWIRDPRSDRPLFLGNLELMRDVPLVGGPFSWKLLLAIGLFVVSIVLLKKLLSRPATVDMLVETEMEMRKVSWPTKDESFNATWVVLLVSLILTLSIFAFDFALRTLLRFVF